MGTHNPQTYRFFLMTLDPVHVGIGGARLGRVDNPIVREPGTNLPKIPGTSLHGVIRAYAAHRYGKPQCAGQGQTHCARPTCPICYTFGYARDQGGGHAGVVAISDARILLFPVYSMVGPVWVTSPTALFDAGFGEKKDNKLVPFKVQDGMAKWPSSLTNTEQAEQDAEEKPSKELKAVKPSQNNDQGRVLNLGWLMVEREGDLTNLELPDKIPEQIRKRVVLVSDKLFSQIVNSNLEVRTSVAINPETGAAEEGALFTYEAIPRATVLWMDMVVSDYRGAFPSSNKVTNWEKQIPDDLRRDLPDEFPSDKSSEIAQALTVLREAGFRLPDAIPGEEQKRKAFWKAFKNSLGGLLQDAHYYTQSDLSWNEALHVLQAGLQWAEHLGVGGMGTRGFGRIRALIHCEVKEDGSLGEYAHGDTEGTENAAQ